MKLDLRHAALAAVFAATPLHAQLPVSRTSAVHTVSMAAGQNVVVNIPYIRTPDLRSKVASSTGDNIVLAATIPGAVTGSSNHVAMIMTGAARGRHFKITAVSGNTVTCTGLGTSGAGLSSSDEVELVPSWTLGTLPLGGLITGGPSNSTNITVLNNGSFVTYYRTSTDWRRSGTNAISNDVVIPFGSSVVVRQPSASTISISGVERIGTVAVEAKVGSFEFVGMPVEGTFTLADLQAQPDITMGTNSTNAPAVLLLNNNSYSTYLWYGNAWRLNGAPTTTIPSTTVIADAGKSFGLRVPSANKRLIFQNF